MLYDTPQYAIFEKEKNDLHMSKLDDELEDLSLKVESPDSFPEMDPTKDYTDIIETALKAEEQFEDSFLEHPENFATICDTSDEFWVLYITYLSNLNHFMDIYGASEELLFAKRWLLYALDKPTAMLFDEKRFKRFLEEASSIELDDDPFSFVTDEVYFMVQEAFMIPSNEYTIRKLLFVGTYYSLTEDEELREIIEEYRDDPRFKIFYEIMINNCSSQSSKGLTEDIKKFVLKSSFKAKENN